MQPLLTIATILAHGGTAGALVEGGLIVGILVIFVAVWMRERGARQGREEDDDDSTGRGAESAPLRDEVD